MERLCDHINRLSNSPQRLRVLDALGDTRADLRDLTAELDSPRTTLQRNLSVLEERGWIERAPSGYTTTTAGCLVFEAFVTMGEAVETIDTMAPFLDAVDAPEEIDVGRLHDPRVTTPEPGQPNAPMKRLLVALDESDRVRGFLPVVSTLLIERFRHTGGSDTTEHEYVVSRDALDALCEQHADEPEASESNPPVQIEMRIYGHDLPYGLFISEDRLALVAYDEVGRMEALVESDNQETIEWGRKVRELPRAIRTAAWVG